jgi:hypothetical protein
MIDRHIRDLRLDRRLQRRRGWISAQELDDALETLPDVAGKGELVTEEEEKASEEPAAAAATPTADPVEPIEGF